MSRRPISVKLGHAPSSAWHGLGAHGGDLFALAPDLGRVG
eukprot:CAMPEP_0182522582 /NCGR_PEP_ID=MMETSP1323-20130603/411_1 /TAXON_ID=236787 /ORGANISM="Florenciella parvula, Strain RCC1693" /LENGTH=39 /DNA_ID= /DNA_START= /DNA_END= /DNA_ORIENTATION=